MIFASSEEDNLKRKSKAKTKAKSQLKSKSTAKIKMTKKKVISRKRVSSKKVKSIKNQPIKKSKAPVAPQIPHKHEKHGDIRLDPYFWMKERNSKPVLKYLRSENKYVEEVMKKDKKLQDTIYKEIRGRVKEDDSSAPFRKGGFWYFVRYETGKEYPILCRKKGTLKAAEEILLDVNVLAKGKKYCALGAWDISPDGKTLAYTMDAVGRRFYDLHFKDLVTGKIAEESVLQISPSFVWANDSQNLFYIEKNSETLREEKIYRYSRAARSRTEIYFEADQEYSVHLGKSLTEKYIYIVSSATDSTEWRTLLADKPFDKPSVVLPRQPKHEYSIHHGGDCFYVRSNSRSMNFQLFRSEEASVGNQKSWEELTPASEEVFLEDVAVFKEVLVLEERFNALTRLRLLKRTSQGELSIEFPDECYVVGLGVNEEYGTDRIRYNYQSMVRPPSVFDYILTTGKSELMKTTEVPTYDLTNYGSKRLWAVARDGEKIPVSLVYKLTTPLDGSAPMLQYGYGSYGISMDAGFRNSAVSLLDRGFVFAIAHVRGGQEKGRKWFEDGRLFKKKNSFFDFIDTTEFLVKQKVCHPQKVFAEGGSAGGLLMGAVANLRPDLYRGMIVAVPFLDVVTTMLDDSIPLTTVEYSQWGNPNEKAAYDYIKSYSPYDNISAKAYPAMLVLTGYHDSQVQYWEPAKYVAQMRKTRTDSNLLLFKTEMAAGHGGASGRFQRLKEIALEFAFLIKILGLPPGEQFKKA